MDRRNPVCKPLFDLDEVLSWQPAQDEFCVSSVARRPRKEQDGPRMLVCHDMRGGYLEDRLVQGCGKQNTYRFFHWQYVDTFVYFSHYFVTIPPPAWTNAGHRNGVKVLGTVITEWDDGKARCKIFLETEESYKAFADQLVKIAKYYGFDGWLINIENVIETGAEVDRLCEFVCYLTTEQHRVCPDSLVIWYDSVITTGKLEWQNALNQHNKQFFDACDGIFLNYCWKGEDLEGSKSCAVECDRPYDVFVGVDVYGRGCLGDGGWNTIEAVEAARKHDLSVALFANSWVYDKLGAENFSSHENRFWELLSPLLRPCVFTSLPIATTFCQGYGERFFDNGMPVGNPWWNITVQDLQPCFCQTHSDNQSAENQSSTGTQSILPGSQPFMSGAGTQSAMLGTKPGLPGAGNGAQLIGNPIPTIGTGKSFLGGSQEFCGNALQQMDVCTDDCFTGGSCLRLTADVVNTKFVEYNLFETAVELKQYTSVYVSITYKILQDPDCDVFLELHLRHDEQSIVLVLLPFPDGDKPVPKFGKDTACMYVHALKQTDLPNLLSVSSPTQNNTRWKTRWFPVYSLYLKFCQLTKVKVGLTTTDPQPKKCIALLGELKIIPVDSLPEKFPQAGFVSVIPDSSPAHPLIEPGKNDFNKSEEESAPKEISWGEDAYGNVIKIPFEELDNMRVSCHTLREFRPGIGGQLCEVLYQLITSLDCFTLHWEPDLPEYIDHYRVYQIKIDSGVAKLLGHVTEPFFKVTWFEIPDYEKDEAVHHFKFVIRPVLKCGIAVPLDYTYCKLFHIASKKSTVTLVQDSCTGMLEPAKDQQKELETDGQNTLKPDDELTKEKEISENKESPKKNPSDSENCDKEVCAKKYVRSDSEEVIQPKDNITSLTEKLQISD
ncbi:uncharacterized protein LOC128219957 [Mya arenaria]|uniref:uncharacterized protein LOC128219957 n=1 Tax=Mya arenaria TaxID=6604 RepID=UPI0022E08232|nr:uncharacterized protein LOC128219957 [Mya arenaria]